MEISWTHYWTNGLAGIVPIFRGTISFTSHWSQILWALAVDLSSYNHLIWAPGKFQIKEGLQKNHLPAALCSTRDASDWNWEMANVDKCNHQLKLYNNPTYFRPSVLTLHTKIRTSFQKCGSLSWCCYWWLEDTECPWKPGPRGVIYFLRRPFHCLNLFFSLSKWPQERFPFSPPSSIH